MSNWRYKKGDRAILLIEVEVLQAHGMDDGWKAYYVQLRPLGSKHSRLVKFDVHQEDLFTEQGLREALLAISP